MKVLLEKKNKETAKLQEKFNDLNKKLVSELEELSSALSNAPYNSSFIDKLGARKDELEKVSQEIENMNLSEKFDVLQQIDFKWPSKELNNLKKSSYKEYNDMKERFYEAGNDSTPTEFLLFENSLHQLESGPRLEYGAELVRALQEVANLVKSQEEKYQDEKRSLELVFEKLESETTSLLDIYLRQASAAKGTDYSSIFTLTEKKVTSLIKEAGDSLEKNRGLFSSKTKELNDTKQKMQDILNDLESESAAKLSLVDSLYRESRKDGKTLEKISLARKMHESGDYVNSLRATSQISTEIEEESNDDSGAILILGITALAVLAAIAVFIVRQQKPKELRKLKKITDF